jgi:ATP-binding cassette subfamily B protein
MRPPSAGRVTIGGVAADALDRDTLRRRVVTVSQFPLFVTDTARANFLLARHDATDAEIEAVCRQTGLWDVLAGLAPDRPLDTMLSRTAGQGLSGGERRLFAITRALLCRPAILLLDEPTTGIDRLAVQALADRLPALLAGLTVIVVEHDMGFVARIADEVCCLEDGRFAETGPPARLAASLSLFQRLSEAQQGLSTTADLTIESVRLPRLDDMHLHDGRKPEGLAKPGFIAPGLIPTGAIHRKD